MITTQDTPPQSLVQLLRGSWIDRALLIVSLLAIAAVWFFIQGSIASGPPVAEIYHGDTMLASYRLPGPGQAPVHFAAEGDLGISEIVIDASGVRMTASPCASQRCVLSGTHRHAGDLIACVPNRILVTIRGSRDNNLDAVVE
ncbi:MAG TPA: NusG domain II-containing protein [Mariprofundaceae bacterium]|nr:NusG domain II-containing protein [Mariprofundaceae bacterium]